MAKQAFTVRRRPPKAARAHAIVREEILKDVKGVNRRAVRAYERAVDNWSSKSKPRFKGEVHVGPRVIRSTVEVQGTARQKKIWRIVNTTGRKPGPIKPKPNNRRGLLFFVWGGPGSYQAKTGAGPARYGGPGRVIDGKLTARKAVFHPGFPARRFDIPINEDTDDELRKAIDRGRQRGLRKLRRQRA